MIALLENLRGFCTSRPPLMLFIICLCSFIVVLFTVTFVVSNQELRNPDIKTDWNTFLEKIADIDFCIKENLTSHVEVPPKITEVVSNLHTELGSGSSQTSADETEKDDPHKVMSAFIPLYVEVRPTALFLDNPQNNTHLTASVSSTDLGLGNGKEASPAINITFGLNYDWASLCRNKRACEKVIIQTCVRFEGQARLFPGTRMPDICPQFNETEGVESIGRMISKKREFGHTVTCGDSPSLHVKYKLDPKLVVMLSLEDRSLINLHLVHTSYFLFVMVVTLLVYAIIRGKPKTKPSHSVEKA